MSSVYSLSGDKLTPIEPIDVRAVVECVLLQEKDGIWMYLSDVPIFIFQFDKQHVAVVIEKDRYPRKEEYIDEFSYMTLALKNIEIKYGVAVLQTEIGEFYGPAATSVSYGRNRIIIDGVPHLMTAFIRKDGVAYSEGLCSRCTPRYNLKYLEKYISYAIGRITSIL